MEKYYNFQVELIYLNSLPNTKLKRKRNDIDCDTISICEIVQDQVIHSKIPKLY